MGLQMGAKTDATYSALGVNTPALGDVYFGTGGKVYKFVLYNAGTAAAAGVANEVAYYYQAGSYKNFEVTSDVSDGVGLGAGVLQSAPADGEYCWIQIKGPATLAGALTAGADGDSLTPTGAGDGNLDLAVAGETDHICAQVDDASAFEIACDFPW